MGVFKLQQCHASPQQHVQTSFHSKEKERGKPCEATHTYMARPTRPTHMLHDAPDNMLQSNRIKQAQRHNPSNMLASH